MKMGHILLKKTFFCVAVAGLLLPVTSGVVAPAAMAQFSDSYNFLKAVKDRKGEDAEKFLSEPGSVIINTRDITSGETALHIVIQRRDSTWLGYLLQKGANPNLADKKGTTPLMLATQLGYVEGIEALTRRKAQVDQSNRAGETALILAAPDIQPANMPSKTAVHRIVPRLSKVMAKRIAQKSQLNSTFRALRGRSN
jgi:hypothetical protein